MDGSKEKTVLEKRGSGGQFARGPLNRPTMLTVSGTSGATADLQTYCQSDKLGSLSQCPATRGPENADGTDACPCCAVIDRGRGRHRWLQRLSLP